MPSFEILLPVGAIAFYLYDSILLLYSNELALTRAGSSWRVSAGSDILLLGRRLFMPNPFTPHRALFRVHWSDDDARADSESDEAVGIFDRHLRPLKILMIVLATLLLGGVPLVTWSVGTGWLLLGLFAAFYLLVFVALGLVFAARARLGITGGKFAMLCVDSLLCAPFAVNLLRKISLQRSLSGNPLSFALRTFAAQTRSELVAIVDARVASEQTGLEADSERYRQLDSFRQRLNGGVP